MILPLLFFFCHIASGQGLVTVQGTITRANGQLAQGQVTISWQAFATATGVQVAPGSMNVPIQNGVFSQPVQLYPNVGATPAGTSYRVQYSLSASPSFTRNWYIPASSVPVQIVTIEFPPQGLLGTTAIVSPAQLTQAGASVNQALCWNGAMWAPGSCGGGGGSSPAAPTGSIQVNGGSGTFGSIGLGTATTLVHGNAAGPPTYGPVVTGDIAAQAVNLATQVFGVVAPGNGGTGTNTPFSQGSVVFAGSAGIFQQDNSHFFYDAAHGRLGIGTTVPGAQVEIDGSSAATTGVSLSLQAAAGNNTNFRFADGNNTKVWIWAATTGGNLGVYDQANNINPFFMTQSDNTIMGGAFDGGYRSDTQSSGSSGTSRVGDRTPGGSTSFVVQAGANQGTNFLMTIANNAGTGQAWVDSAFGFNAKTFQDSSFVPVFGLTNVGAGLGLGSAARINWSSTTSYLGTVDTQLGKFGPGILEVNNGTIGQRFGTGFYTGSLLVYDNTPTTGVTSPVIQAGAGQASNNLLTFKNNGGTQFGAFTNAGAMIATVFQPALSTVSFSATPNFDLSLGNTIKMTLTGNVTSSTISNQVAGQRTSFVICQDGTGNRTLVWPANVKGPMTIGGTLSKCSAQDFISDGTNLYATTMGVLNQ